MPTKRGRKSRPVLKIFGWKTADGEQPAPAERQITAEAAERDAARAEMDDEIPF